jgi:hypothetical protein
MFKKNLAALLFLFSAIFIFDSAARAQETEAASSSSLTGVALPAGANRVLPGSIPAEVTQAFDKVIASGNGKVRKGDSEVLVWDASGSKKAKTDGIVSRLTSTLQAAGWKYSVEGNDGGVTVFSLIKDAAERRAVVGFYGVSSDVFIFSWMEVVPAEGSGAQNQTETGAQTEQEPVRQNNPVRNSGGSIVGSWYDGYSSILVGYTPVLGPKSFTPGRSHYFNYKFYANGTYEFTGLMQSTMYGCTTSWFQDKRGRYTIDGNQITLTLTKNFFRQHNSCAASGNKEINYKLDPETYTLTVKRNDSGKEAVCLNSGEGDACYEREQK